MLIFTSPTALAARLSRPPLRRFGLSLCALLLAVIATPQAATAADINTGGATGAYHSTFCPLLERRLQGKSANGDYRCKTSAGTRENVERVYLHPRSIGYGQLDVIALETAEMEQSPFTILRSDDVKECIFAVTRNREIRSYGDIVGYASQLKFILPPVGSGSAGTFQYLQEIDPDGLGLASHVVSGNSTDDAIIRALNSKDAVTFFVQFPDPKNARFKMIKRLGGQLVPVIDRNILRQKINGKQVYFAEATSVPNADWSSVGKEAVTACTPLVVFTGADWRINNQADRESHGELIRAVRGLNAVALRPRKGIWSRLVSRTRSLTAKARERLLVLSEKARKKARPVMERAKQKAMELGEKAARINEIAKEKARPR